MQLPIQSKPIQRSALGTGSAAITPSYWCDICYSALGGVLDAVVGSSCAVAEVGFEAACNAALDEIPIIGEGPSEIVCAAAGVLLGEECHGTLTSSVASAIAHAACNKAC